MSEALAIVLAAGKGTRMESDLPKVLVPACGRPMIEYVLDALESAGVRKFVIVVGYRADDVRAALRQRLNIVFADQVEQRGTGHAVMMCKTEIARHAATSHVGPVLVVTGDSPLVQVASLRTLLDVYERERPACILGSLQSDDPHGLGRIVRDGDGRFLNIVEEKDATPEQRQLTEVNMSTYVFDAAALLASLDELTDDNQQGEYYITDCPGILRRRGHDVRALPVLQPCEALSVNNMAQLTVVEEEMRNLGMAE